MIRPLLLAALLLVPSAASAELRLQITAPDGPVKVGTAVILDSTGSVGTVNWATPSSLKGKVLNGCGGQILIFFEKPGSYEFHLYGTNDRDEDTQMLDHRSHVVVVEGKADDPKDPPPPADGFADLQLLSDSLASQLGDARARRTLAAALEALRPSGDLPAMQQQLEDAFTVAQAQRTGDSRDVDWEGSWYFPILRELEKAFKSGKLRTADDYRKAVASVAKGLGS